MTGQNAIVAAAQAEYDRWGTAGDTGRDPDRRNWVVRLDDADAWIETTAHRHLDEAEKAMRGQALKAAVAAAFRAAAAGLDI